MQTYTTNYQTTVTPTDYTTVTPTDYTTVTPTISNSFIVNFHSNGGTFIFDKQNNVITKEYPVGTTVVSYPNIQRYGYSLSRWNAIGVSELHSVILWETVQPGRIIDCYPEWVENTTPYPTTPYPTTPTVTPTDYTTVTPINDIYTFGDSMGFFGYEYNNYNDAYNAAMYFLRTHNYRNVSLFKNREWLCTVVNPNYIETTTTDYPTTTPYWETTIPAYIPFGAYTYFDTMSYNYDASLTYNGIYYTYNDAYSAAYQHMFLTYKDVSYIYQALEHGMLYYTNTVDKWPTITPTNCSGEIIPTTDCLTEKFVTREEYNALVDRLGIITDKMNKIIKFAKTL